MNYYNEFDPKAAAWLRELIKAGLIPDGWVDERSILDVNPYELTQYTQHHFFAGIGGWSLALQLAGWPEKRRVVTGSCPCQPYSSAGKRKGDKDERNLWPVFRNIITFLETPIAFGEQTASAAGRIWLSGVRTDLEGLGYAVGAADLCAASVGAPHIRQRLYWMADSARKRRKEWAERQIGKSHRRGLAQRCGSPVGLGNPDGQRLSERQESNIKPATGLQAPRRTDSVRSGFWDAFAIVHCTDGKTRRFEPGSFPLAHGVPDRVGLLRGYGNAIVPENAAEFIISVCEVI